MGMRSHRRSVMLWSPPGGRADRYGRPAFTQVARSRRIRWWFRTGGLLAVIGITRLVRGMRAHWRSVFFVTGAALIAVGVVLANGVVLVPGILVVLIAAGRIVSARARRNTARMSL